MTARGIWRRRAGILILAVAAVYVLMSWQKTDVVRAALQISLSSKSSVQRVNVWTQAIKERGSTGAYRQLVQLAAPLSSDSQHALGHYFGQALYNTQGLSGFGVCDNSLFGGCMHEFVAAAIQEHGINILALLNKDCQALSSHSGPTTCQHGLGHGMVSYFGYTMQNLSDALDACRSLDSDNPTEGCYGGAFMEFNLHTVAGGRVRNEVAGHPYAPCDSLPAVYDDACYFWLPQWIRADRHLEHGVISTFRTIGDYCAGASTRQDTLSCFRGLGYIAAPDSLFNYERAKTKCSASADNPEFQDACWRVASLTLPAPKAASPAGSE